MQTVLFHGGCTDGFCAAWVIQKQFPEAQFQAVNYGQSPPWGIIDGLDVCVVDFSYNREVMIEMSQRAKSLICLDHHETAEEALKGLHFCHFEPNQSGAMMAWKYFFPRYPVPDIVKYVEDRDLWKWALPNSKEYSACLGSYPFDFAGWDTLSVIDPSLLIIEGQAILRYKDQLVKRIVGNAYETQLDGQKVLIVNTCVLQSEVGEELAKDRPFSVSYFYKDTNTLIHSLRSSPTGVNVSKIAKKYPGGGGHKHSAGFTIKV